MRLIKVIEMTTVLAIFFFFLFANASEKQRPPIPYVYLDQLTVKGGLLVDKDDYQPYSGYIRPRRGSLELMGEENNKNYLLIGIEKGVMHNLQQQKDYDYLIVDYLDTESVTIEQRAKNGIMTFVCCQTNKQKTFSIDEYLNGNANATVLWMAKKSNVKTSYSFYCDGKCTSKISITSDGVIRMETHGDNEMLYNVAFDTQKKLVGNSKVNHKNGEKFYQTTYNNGYPSSIVDLYDQKGNKIFRLYFKTHSSTLLLVEEWNEDKRIFEKRDVNQFNLLFHLDLLSISARNKEIVLKNNNKDVFKLHLSDNLENKVLFAEGWDEKNKKFMKYDLNHIYLFLCFSHPLYFLYSQDFDSEYTRVISLLFQCAKKRAESSEQSIAPLEKMILQLESSKL